MNDVGGSNQLDATPVGPIFWFHERMIRRSIGAESLRALIGALLAVSMFGSFSVLVSR